ncbi:RNA 2',3'-cyclic phosphodiesterase [Rheinheimera sp. 4Y26]|uniref:RNA 2',3'-cyclic phosphodiesterase n=1 Tax=Rheinheimera sp. 4Y26 TaxID=2977811 RepID=UPI0021B14D19|nr:RNA 2',3'-cyclic phosphodiesterase [Rheinheimera sp. 4Y26]MCT6701025.1 RNA 2',3'-cyclic phosphodiesterase [Rheinheimera sp. 4Y26]
MKTELELSECDSLAFDWQGERRLFIGVAPSAQQQQTLNALLQQLQAPLQPVKPTNLHLTLLFLGQSSAAQTELLWQQLKTQQLPAFTVLLNQLELWPGPGVYCLTGVLQHRGLMQLDIQLRQAALQAGFLPPQHALRPHITLARKAKVLPAAAPQPPEVLLAPEKLTLYHSLSTPNGVRYLPLASLPLQR